MVSEVVLDVFVGVVVVPGLEDRLPTFEELTVPDEPVPDVTSLDEDCVVSAVVVGVVVVVDEAVFDAVLGVIGDTIVDPGLEDEVIMFEELEVPDNPVSDVTPSDVVGTVVDDAGAGVAGAGV
ncbi:MAG: hypothetical protein ACREQ5_36105, partial [Candidatus Dormibacteria bacterium]